MAFVPRPGAVRREPILLAADDDWDAPDGSFASPSPLADDISDPREVVLIESTAARQQLRGLIAEMQQERRGGRPVSTSSSAVRG